MIRQTDTVLITGAAGFIGRALMQRLSKACTVVGLDLSAPDAMPENASFTQIDLSSEESVRGALSRVRREHGSTIASVVHLAAYFDLTGEPSHKYDQITVRGTERLLLALQQFQTEQFICASSMLAHKAGGPGETINEEWPLESKLPYRDSKIKAERVIHAKRGAMPVVYMRPAGVYDDMCHNPFLAHQIARIYERDPKGHIYPGDPRTGQSFLHLDDLLDAIVRIVERRRQLGAEVAILLGEPQAIGYGELQREIGSLVRGEDWQTWEVPKPLAKAGAWVEEDLLDERPFIRSWMVDIADDHYEVDINRARTLLGWQPRHSLRTTLPRMIKALKANPAEWYRANKLNTAKVAGSGTAARMKTAAAEHAMQGEAMQRHMSSMAEMHRMLLWAHFLVVGLGVWLLTSPVQYSLFDAAAAAPLRDISTERSLWDPALRNALTGWSDIVCGLLLILFGSLALSPRFAWAQWGTTVVGIWLLFAPLVLWTPSAAAYMNDTIIGAFAIALSVLIPMMPGMSHEGMMDENTVPPGWTYSPSSWLQRLPIIALGLFGFFIARDLAAYQMGHVNAVWEPFFAGEGVKNGTEHIITSATSRAWPIPDGGLGATSYLIEALMGAMGSATRWRTMPWMVTFFFILVVPLGGVSIFFIIIQPITIGTYCTLCLIAAVAMLIMIPLTLDEVVAMAQYMWRSVKAGRPFWRTFFQGGPEPLGDKDEEDPGFSAPIARQVMAAVRGVTVPWPLLASCGLGAWLMFSRLVFGTQDGIADSDHLVGALIITVAVCAMAEVTRVLRFINPMFGLWLIAAPWLLEGATTAGAWNDVVVGVLIIALSLPRGTRSAEHYGRWDRYVV